MPTVSYTPEFECESAEVTFNATSQCTEDCKPKFPNKVESIVSEWSLVCNRQILITLPDSLYMGGKTLGAIIVGPLIDRFGRRVSSILSMFGFAISLGVPLFSIGFNGFCSMRLFQGFFSAACYNAIQCLFIELLPVNLRAPLSPLIDCSSGLGSVLVGVTGIVFSEWRHTFWTYVSYAIVCFICLLFFKESNEWLKGRSAVTDTKSETKKFLKSKPTLWLTTKLICMWITTNSLFYGLTLNTELLEGSIPRNMIIFGAMDTVSCLVLMSFNGKVRRKFSMAGTYSLCGLVLLSSAIFQIYGLDPKTALALTFLGKFFISMNFALIYLYTGELYPTTCRSLGFAICTGVARTLGIALPFVTDGELLYGIDIKIFLVGRSIIWLPGMLFGSCAVFSALVTLTLPDTSNRELPTTVDEALDLYKQPFSKPFDCIKKVTGL